MGRDIPLDTSKVSFVSVVIRIMPKLLALLFPSSLRFCMAVPHRRRVLVYIFAQDKIETRERDRHSVTGGERIGALHAIVITSSRGLYLRNQTVLVVVVVARPPLSSFRVSTLFPGKTECLSSCRLQPMIKLRRRRAHIVAYRRRSICYTDTVTTTHQSGGLDRNSTEDVRSDGR